MPGFLRFLSVFVLVPFMLVGCASKPVPFEIVADASLSMPARIDLIVVYGNIADQLMAGGVQWFENRQAFVAAYPQQVAVAAYNIPPLYVAEQVHWPHFAGDQPRYFIGAVGEVQYHMLEVDARLLKTLHITSDGLRIDVY